MILKREEVIEAIRQVVQEVLKLSGNSRELTERTSLIYDLDADSLDQTTILMKLEEQFPNINSDDFDISKERTIGDIADFICASAELAVA